MDGWHAILCTCQSDQKYFLYVQQYMSKLEDLRVYLKNGFDVVSIQGQSKQILWLKATEILENFCQ